MSLDNRELLFGGAAGGGKSEWAIMSALQYIDVPGYSALILRRTWPDLNSPGAILERFTEWMAPFTNTKEVHRGDQGRIWTFPSGAKIQFGYAQREDAKLKFQGAEYQFIVLDEATQFEPEIYLYLLSRLRKPTIPCVICTSPLTRYVVDGQIRYRHAENNTGCEMPLPDPTAISKYPPAPDGTTIFEVPLRLRATANPGGIGHEFFRKRFIDPETRIKDGVFIPSALKDNPSLNTAEYMGNLAHLSLVDRERLLNGNWEIMDEGNLFDRGSFEYLDKAPDPKDVKYRCRFWDFAASDGSNSDYTVGALCSVLHDGRWVVENLKRVQKLPAGVEELVKDTALNDGIEVKIFSEQEPGSAGKSMVHYYKKFVLPGYQYMGIRSTGSKTDRAGALVSQASDRNVFLVKADWNKDFLDEASAFPSGPHDDQIDAIAGAFNQMLLNGRRKIRIVV